MTIEQLFFELIEVAIGKKYTLSKTPTENEWIALSTIAEKHTLSGICAVAIHILSSQNQMPPKDIYWKMLGAAALIVERNKRVDDYCIKLQSTLLKKGFRTSILKGQGVALYYPLKLAIYRQPGDIDVWIDASREKVLDYSMRVCPSREFDAKHIHFHIYKDIEVELHWIPSVSHNPSINRKLVKFYRNEIDIQMTNSIELYTRKNSIVIPDADFNAVYLLVHMYEHFLYEGIGLRQLMDYYFVIIHISDKKKVEDYLSTLKITRFVSAVMYVLKIIFDLEKKYMLCVPNEKHGKFLLQEIMIGGNFGLYNNENVAKNNKPQRLLFRLKRRLRLFQYDPTGIFWRSVFHIRLAIWKNITLKHYKSYFKFNN